MPWYRTEHVIPKCETEITTFSNGKKETRKYAAGELFTGDGKLNKEFPKWWTYNPDLPDPPEDKDSGIDHMIAHVQEERVDNEVEAKSVP